MLIGNCRDTEISRIIMDKTRLTGYRVKKMTSTRSEKSNRYSTSSRFPKGIPIIKNAIDRRMKKRRMTFLF